MELDEFAEETVDESDYVNIRVDGVSIRDTNDNDDLETKVIHVNIPL